MLFANDPISFPWFKLELDPSRGIELGFLNIRWYGLIIAIGLTLAVIYGLRRCKQFGIKQDDIIDGVLWIVPFAVICARLYYCIFSWSDYAANPIKILYIWEGGLAIYGGVIGALIGVIVFCKVKKINVWALFDLVSLGFMIGQSIGRWGNFFNREAFGSYCDNIFAMRISSSHIPVPENPTAVFLANKELLLQKAMEGNYAGMIQVHPTFLYESLWNIAGFAALHFISKNRKFDGQIALCYVIWYGLGRAIIEGLRMDSLMWGPIRVSQLLAAVSCVAAAAVLVVFAITRSKKPLYVSTLETTDECH